jgi:hypothetical protein
MRWIVIFVVSFFTINRVEAQIGRFVNQTEIGFLTGKIEYPYFSIRSFNGIRFKNVPVETGVAVGVDSYSPIIITPVTLSLIWNPLQTKSVSPYLGFDMGYGFDWLQPKSEGKSYSGGYLLSPSAGIRIKTNSNYKFILNLSYKHQEASISTGSDLPPFNVNYWSYRTDHYTFKRLFISLGLSF